MFCQCAVFFLTMICPALNNGVLNPPGTAQHPARLITSCFDLNALIPHKHHWSPLVLPEIGRPVKMINKQLVSKSDFVTVELTPPIPCSNIPLSVCIRGFKRSVRWLPYYSDTCKEKQVSETRLFFTQIVKTDDSCYILFSENLYTSTTLVPFH